MSVADRHILVTGGGSGVGAACARLLADGGARVTILGRTEATLATQSLPFQVCDVTNADAVETAVRNAREHAGPIDVVIANAGAAESVPFAKMKPQVLQDMGISFLKQYADSGIDLPVVGPAFSFDQGILQAVGDAALGVKNTSQWNKDIDNEANKAFVEAFQAEYGRLPSLYASQGYDTANLLLSAMAKADVKDADAFRAALKEADFASTRGDFKFGPNHHPIQDIYVREVIKEGDVFTNKILAAALTDHGPVAAVLCSR